MNVVFEDSVGAQARQWFKDVLASSKIDFNKAIASRVTVKMVAEPSVPGHNDYACTTAIPGGWLVEIRRGLDDPASPLVANIPGPARLFFMETVAHELAHVLIGQTKADPARLCPLFVRAGLAGTIVVGTQADWNISTRPSVVRFQWEDRIEEAVAEIVKDAALPDRRVYDNRTNWRLPQANFGALMTALLGAGGEFIDDFDTDSSSRYLTSSDNAVYSNGRVRSAGGAVELTPRAAHFGHNLHVQVEVRASDPATAIVGVMLSDPVGGGGNTIMFALVEGNVFLQGDIEPASFGAHTFWDLQVNGATTTASVKDAAQAVLYSRTFATPAMSAFQPSLLLFDNAEVERWSAIGDPVIVTYTTVPDRTITGERKTLSWQSSAISPVFSYSPPWLGDPFPGHVWDIKPWWYDVYFENRRQLRVWVYDVSDTWANRDRHAYLEVWPMPFVWWRAPDPEGPDVGESSLGQVSAGGQEDLVAYTDGTVPIDDTPFTQANVAWLVGLGDEGFRDEFPGLGVWLGTSTGTLVQHPPELGLFDEITYGPDEHAIHRLQAAGQIVNPGALRTTNYDPTVHDPWLDSPVCYVNSNPEGIDYWSSVTPHVIPPPPDVPVYLVITVLIDATGLVEPDPRSPLSEVEYVWQKGQEEAARSLWPKVVSVIPDRVIPGYTTVEVQSVHSELPDWPYVPPFVAASAGAPAALRLR